MLNKLAERLGLHPEQFLGTGQRVIKYGFTGTQNGMTEMQRWRFMELVLEGISRNITPELRHGCCVGSDEQAALLFKYFGWFIMAYPPEDRSRMSFVAYEISNQIKPPAEFLVRDKNIVTDSDLVVATPNEMGEVLRSGTWATIREGTRQKKPVTVIFPDGSLELR